MKMFLAAAVFFVAAVAASAFVYQGLGENSSEVYSLDSARVDHRAPLDGRLGWAAGEGAAAEGGGG